MSNNSVLENLTGRLLFNKEDQKAYRKALSNYRRLMEKQGRKPLSEQEQRELAQVSSKVHFYTRRAGFFGAGMVGGVLTVIGTGIGVNLLSKKAEAETREIAINEYLRGLAEFRGISEQINGIIDFFEGTYELADYRNGRVVPIFQQNLSQDDLYLVITPIESFPEDGFSGIAMHEKSPEGISTLFLNQSIEDVDNRILGATLLHEAYHGWSGIAGPEKDFHTDNTPWDIFLQGEVEAFDLEISGYSGLGGRYAEKIAEIAERSVTPEHLANGDILVEMPEEFTYEIAASLDEHITLADSAQSYGTFAATALTAINFYMIDRAFEKIQNGELQSEWGSAEELKMATIAAMMEQYASPRVMIDSRKQESDRVGLFSALFDGINATRSQAAFVNVNKGYIV